MREKLQLISAQMMSYSGDDTAPIGERGIAHIIDIFLLFGLSELISYFYELYPPPLGIKILVFTSLVFLVFWISFWLKGSIGKRLLKLRIIDKEGDTVSLLSFFVRSSYAIFFSYIFLMSHISPNYPKAYYNFVFGVIALLHFGDCGTTYMMKRRYRIWDILTDTAVVSTRPNPHIKIIES